MPRTVLHPVPTPRRAPASRALVLLLTATLMGCSMLPSAAARAPSPERIAALERARTQRPDDLLLLVELGAAYRAAGRPAESWPVLERALSVAPDDPAVTLQLALTYEAMEEWLDARLLYRNYVEVGRSAPAVAAARNRLALLERMILSESLIEAFEAERPLETAAADPDRMLVLPFGYTGINPDLVPLARVLSEAIAGELVNGGGLSVPDDNRVRLLLARLEPTGDPEQHVQAVARGARVLGAGRVLRGRIMDTPDGTIRVEAELVDALTDETIGEFTESAPLRDFTQLGRRVATTVRAMLELPPASISGVPMRAPSGAPTQTLVWYGRGLLAEDRGETAAAVEAYQNAIGLDPRFDAARGRLAEALAVNRARATPLAQMAALASRELPGPLTGLQEVRRLVPSGIGGRDAVAEALGVEGVGREVILEIVVQPAEL